MSKIPALVVTDKDASFQAVAESLGGGVVFDWIPHTRLEVHDLLEAGLPASALNYLISGTEFLREPVLMEKAVGISVRALQRQRHTAKLLSSEQSSRLWALADILQKATRVLGSRQEAEDWLLRHVMALDHRRPLALIATFPGQQLVDEALERMEHGVYT